MELAVGLQQYCTLPNEAHLGVKTLAILDPRKTRTFYYHKLIFYQVFCVNRLGEFETACNAGLMSPPR